MLESFHIDPGDFNNKFRIITENTIPALAEQGLFQGATLLIRDAITQPPFAPHKLGFLWRSQRVIITQPAQGGLGSPIEVTAGFNIIYAAPLHEGEVNWNWTLAGSGPNYLALKLAANREAYMKAAADYIAANGGG